MAATGAGTSGRRVYWLGSAIALRQREGKGRADSQRALHRNIAAHEAGEMAADRQSQAGAAICAGGTAVDLAELFKDVPSASAGMPMPVSATADDHAAVVAASADGNRPSVGKFDRIPQEIHQDLLHLIAIRHQPGHVGIDLCTSRTCSLLSIGSTVCRHSAISGPRSNSPDRLRSGRLRPWPGRAYR